MSSAAGFEHTVMVLLEAQGGIDGNKACPVDRLQVGLRAHGSPPQLGQRLSHSTLHTRIQSCL